MEDIFLIWKKKNQTQLFSTKLENKIGTWNANDPQYGSAEYNKVRNVGDKAGQSVLCDLGSTHPSHSGYPCGHARLAGTHTHAESQLNGRAHSANHSLPLLPLQMKPDAGPPARAQAANPSRYGEHRPTFHVGSSDNMSIAKQSYLANTTRFYQFLS